MQVIKVGNAALPIFKVKYNDGTVVEFDTEEELRAVLDVRDLPEFKDMVSRVKVAFQYLKDRMEGNCSNCYDCSGVVETCRVARIFNPTFAAAKLCAPFVDELCAAIPSLRDQADALKAELHAYRQAATQAPPIDAGDVHEFTEAVLLFWRTNKKKLSAWAGAAKVVFSLSPNSAASERVFALLKNMFGATQDSALADYIEAALMLRYNKRQVG